MNFSKSCTLKKAMSLIMVIVLAAATLTGCFKKDDNTTEPSTDSGLNLDLSTPTESTEAPTETTEAPTEKTGENMGTVTNLQNVRSIPSMDATIVHQLAVGDRVEILRQETAAGFVWGLIEEPVRGWVVMDYIEMDNGGTVPPADPTAPSETTPSGGGSSSSGESVNMKGVITGNGLSIREAPGTSSNRVGSYNKGDVVTILELKDGWGRTNKGWVSMDYVNTSNTSATNATTPTTGSSNNGGNTGSSTISGNGSTTVIARGIVTAKKLNLRSSASSTENDPIGSLSYGDRVNILEKSGSWGRTSKGWISLNYVYQDGTTGTNTATGTITASQLRIRSGPGIGYDSVGSYESGDEVKILEQFTYSGTTWGCTNKGWISMDFVDVTEGSTGGDSGLNWEGSGSSDTGSSSTGKTTGTVTANSLYIRSGAGTNYDTVGFLTKGDTVTILATTTVNGVTWGQISSGWISMRYVDTTGSSSSSSSDSSSMWVD